MKINKKQVISMLFIIFSCIVVFVYNNYQNKRELTSFNAELLNTVTLAEDNCKTATENNITTIKKYNGNADKIIIEKA